MNRRQLLKSIPGAAFLGALTPSITSRGAVAKGVERARFDFDYTPFLDLFNTIYLQDDETPEFPLPFHNSGFDMQYVKPYCVKRSSYSRIIKKLDFDAMQVILVTAIDRNILVFPETKPLISDMCDCMRDNGFRNKMTDIYMCEDITTNIIVPENAPKIHRIRKDYWKHVEASYVKFHGTYPNKCKNLMIGLDLSPHSKIDFIHYRRNNGHPTIHSDDDYSMEVGMATLNNNGILLGAF